MTGNGPEKGSFFRRSRLLQILGGYLAVGFGALQVVDMFVERLPVPDWVFVAVLVLLVVGAVVITATALLQDRASGSWLTWRRAIAGGAGSFVLLVTAVGAFMGMRAFGVGPLGSLLAAGVIERSERILLSDFQSQTGDVLLAGAVTEAFRVDFEQSRIVSLVEPGHVRDALVRMQRAPDSPVDPQLARELAQREGIKAVLTGEINTAGRTFIVSARLVTADTDSVLVSLRETARDSAAIISAIDQLSSRMRERIGESLVAIRGSDRLEQVTTSSLPALRLYSQAVRALELERDAARGVPLLEEAIRHDSMFAMAHRKLGVALSNDNQPRDRWAPAYTRAYELSDRLSDRERYLAHAAYYRYVQNDVDRAMVAYQTLLDSYPNETAALNNLALLHTERGSRDQAVDLYRRALAIDPHRPIYYTNMIHSLVALGRGAEARTAFDEFSRRFPEHAQLPLYRAGFAYLDGDIAAAEGHLRELLGSRQQGLRGAGEAGLGSLEMLRGRVAAARRHIERAFELSSVPPEWRKLRLGSLEVQVALDITADTAAALRMVESFVRDADAFTIDPTGSLLLDVAQLYAALGQPARARALLSRYDRLPLTDELRAASRLSRLLTDARLLLADGDEKRGMEELIRAVRDMGCEPCADLAVGSAYEQIGMPDSAIARLERFVAAPWLFRADFDSQNLPQTHERLGSLYERRGDVQSAIRHYARFTELWADADPELKPRVEAARQRIVALRRGSG